MLSDSIKAALEAAKELAAEGMVSVAEAVRLSGLSRAELYARMGRGELAFAKDGRRRLIPRKALTEMAAKALVATQGE
jgi:excisionase family DNA binding protein